MWKANKLVTILLWVLALVSVAICAYAFIACGQLDAKMNRAEMMSVIDPMLILAYVLVGLAALLAVFLPVPQVVGNPKSAVGIVIGIVCLGVVIGLSFAFASVEQLPFTPGHAPVSDETLKFADVNIISVYIMLAATIVVTLGASLANMIKLR
ncbi:MAG: hypothetical protein LBD35_00630 [Prevotellaceae bacterium]|jgi:hypothetical protein|nr:hypothetical protein [Prevotellaceae bacterium]